MIVNLPIMEDIVNIATRTDSSGEVKTVHWIEAMVWNVVSLFTALRKHHKDLS